MAKQQAKQYEYLDSNTANTTQKEFLLKVSCYQMKNGQQPDDALNSVESAGLLSQRA